MTISDSSQSNEYFDAAYRETPPWDIGTPQPDMLALLDEFPPTGPVLDVGCGTGELAFAIAQRSLKVLGVDLASAAIDQARAKIATLAPSIRQLVEFRVGDALHPARIPGPFGAVVDSGFYHVFGPTERDGFVRDLAAALTDGGRYYLLGFAIESPFPNTPKPVRESELRERFTSERGWRLLAVRPAQFQLRSARAKVPAIAACIERMQQG